MDSLSVIAGTLFSIVAYTAISVVIRFIVVQGPVSHRAAILILLPQLFFFAFVDIWISDMEKRSTAHERYPIEASSPQGGFGSPVLYASLGFSYLLLRLKKREASESSQSKKELDQ